MQKISKKPQFARKCIFCQLNNANSREHFYPEWMHDLLPMGSDGKYSGEIINQHPKTRVVSRHDRRTKPGELYTKKIKVVCQRCNNGWMSGLEIAVQPLLTPIIKGESATFDRKDLEIIAQWATLKALVCEHDTPSTAVTPQEDRTAFMEMLTIPAYFNIYLLNHSCPTRIGYVRTSHTVSLTRDGPLPPLEGRQKNTQQISVILGSVMLHINAARLDGFRIEDFLTMPAIMSRRIWPPNIAPLTWPSAPILTNDQMQALAYSIERISEQPNVKWGGELPPLPTS